MTTGATVGIIAKHSGVFGARAGASLAGLFVLALVATGSTVEIVSK
jgi:hypothetical protein